MSQAPLEQNSVGPHCAWLDLLLLRQLKRKSTVPSMEKETRHRTEESLLDTCWLMASQSMGNLTAITRYLRVVLLRNAPATQIVLFYYFSKCLFFWLFIFFDLYFSHVHHTPFQIHNLFLLIIFTYEYKWEKCKLKPAESIQGYLHVCVSKADHSALNIQSGGLSMENSNFSTQHLVIACSSSSMMDTMWISTRKGLSERGGWAGPGFASRLKSRGWGRSRLWHWTQASSKDRNGPFLSIFQKINTVSALYWLSLNWVP